MFSINWKNVFRVSVCIFFFIIKILPGKKECLNVSGLQWYVGILLPVFLIWEPCAELGIKLKR